MLFDAKALLLRDLNQASIQFNNKKNQSINEASEL
jgi:hypothetical protein